MLSPTRLSQHGNPLLWADEWRVFRELDEDSQLTLQAAIAQAYAAAVDTVPFPAKRFLVGDEARQEFDASWTRCREFAVRCYDAIASILLQTGHLTESLRQAGRVTETLVAEEIPAMVCDAMVSAKLIPHSLNVSDATETTVMFGRNRVSPVLVKRIESFIHHRALFFSSQLLLEVQRGSCALVTPDTILVADGAVVADRRRKHPDAHPEVLAYLKNVSLENGARATLHDFANVAGRKDDTALGAWRRGDKRYYSAADERDFKATLQLNPKQFADRLAKYKASQR